MAVFHDSVGTGALFNESVISFPIPIDLFWTHEARGSQVAVVAAVSYWVDQAKLTDFTMRKCWYGAVEMKSLGVKPWGTDTAHGWTELFGLLNPPKGPQIIHAEVLGGIPFLGKLARGNSVSYTGADSFGTVTNAAGAAAGVQSVSASGVPSSKLVAAFGGSPTGLTGFNQTQRYLSNTAMALLIGDAEGAQNLTFQATRAKAGDWSALAVVINPADIVATPDSLAVDPDIRSTAKRYPRPGVTRRAVFNITPDN